MATAPFDTLRIARALKDAGFDDAQSEAIVSAIVQSLGENVVTKSDLDAGLSDMQRALSELRADIYRALWIQGAGLVMIIVALMTIVRAFS